MGRRGRKPRPRCGQRILSKTLRGVQHDRPTFSAAAPRSARSPPPRPSCHLPPSPSPYGRALRRTARPIRRADALGTSFPQERAAGAPVVLSTSTAQGVDTWAIKDGMGTHVPSEHWSAGWISRSSPEECENAHGRCSKAFHRGSRRTGSSFAAPSPIGRVRIAGGISHAGRAVARPSRRTPRRAAVGRVPHRAGGDRESMCRRRAGLRRSSRRRGHSGHRGAHRP
jgi:hypothetical protein